MGSVFVVGKKEIRSMKAKLKKAGFIVTKIKRRTVVTSKNRKAQAAEIFHRRKR